MNSQGAHRSLLPKVEPGSSSSSPIDAIPASGEGPPAKRRCISSACMPCRKRKSKCDGQRPACHACTAVYNTQCHYDLDSDNRRKGALKKNIAVLEAEVGPRNTILEALAKGSDADVDDIVQLLRSSPDYNEIAKTAEQMIKTANGKGGPSADIEGTLAEYSGKATTGKPGDIALYGHTSNLPTGLDDNPPSGIAQLGTWTDITSDDGLISDLLNGYLSWHHPMYMLFSEEVFMHGMKDRKLKYCTPLLVNAVLAVGCHFSDREEAKADNSDPSTLGDHFFSEAERLFRLDSRPCLTTTQALALMSLHLAMNSKDSAGWLYFCQSIGMAIELGLNKDQASLKNSKITASEVQARRITFWGLYFLQTAWAICVGRISLLPRTAIRVERPNILEHLEFKPWRPYGHSDHIDSVPSPLEQRGFSYTLLSQSGQLCELVDDIVQMFYAPRDRVTGRRLQIHHGKLKAWLAALPRCLAIKESEPTLPQVICLHMFYYNCKVNLFRPFIRLEMLDSIKQPKEICTDAANKISELLRLCVNTYGLKRVGFLYIHCVMTATILHLLNVSDTSKSTEQSEAYLCEAIRALYEMKSSFSIVERYLRSIRSLTLEWCPHGVPQAVADTLSEINIGSPTSHSSTSSSIYPTTTLPINARKPSAPELILKQQLEEPTPQSNVNFPYWTPFSQMQDGMPLGPIENGDGHMAITSMLDGEYPRLQRDGFTMGVGFDDESSAWSLGLNWDQSGRGVM